jgi:outer membrane protein OmpA-like peptidoglycan-associated protein
VSRSLSFWQGLLLFLVLLLGLGGAAAGLFALGDRYWPWQNVFRIQAEFANVRGVEAGTPVRVLGITAGEVEKVAWVPTPEGVKVSLVFRIKCQVNDTDLRNLIRSNATAQIVDEGMVGGKVIEIIPGNAKDAVAENGRIEGLAGGGLTDTLNEFSSVVKTRENDKVYKAILETLEKTKSAVEQGEKTMASAQRDLDALKKVPVLGGYVEDPVEILVRPNCERNRWAFSEKELFEDGRAVLNSRGQQLLDGVAPQMVNFKQKGTEVVVVTFADPQSNSAEVALHLTRQRSEAVLNYLKGAHKVDGPRLWGWWWSERKVKALGMGVRPSPVEEKGNPPAARTEVLVFVPQN